DQQQIYVHAQKDLDLLTENDRTEVVKNNQHLTVHTDRVQQVKGNDHRTVDGETREKIGGDHSLTVGGSHHSHQGKGQLIEAGQEIHHKAGMKVVIEAGAEVTLAAGGSFVKVDPSGVSVSGPMVKMNSGGAPGSGSGVSAQSPGSPQGVTAKGGKVEPEALATTDQRPKGDPSATIDRLKAAAATGAVSASACSQDENGHCTVHDHGSGGQSGSGGAASATPSAAQTAKNQKSTQNRTLRIGVFFDGTSCNMETDRQRDDRDVTNIAKLYDLYQEREGITRIYQPGPGAIPESSVNNNTEADTSVVGLAFGIGPEGGHTRIKQALAGIRRVLAASEYKNIVFDIFGFSRGAALARHFVNLVQQWPQNILLPRYDWDFWVPPLPGNGLEWVEAFPQQATGSVGFVGLFDTVGSFYLPGNNANLDFNLNLATGSAETVFQISAHHEIRENFPLSSLRDESGRLPVTMQQSAFPGVHADIGGGYENPTGTMNHEIFHVETWAGLGANGRTIRDAQQKVKEWNENDPRNLQMRVEGIDVIVEERRPTRKELSIHVLHAMHEAASTAGVPLDGLDPSNPNHQIPDQLKQALTQWEAAGGSLDAAEQYLSSYVHTSARSGSIAHAPEPSGERTIFANAPTKAITG
ncbi:putative alpha/beta hydrolase family protein DUF2235, partial [Tamilnaduibacter salinus]